MDVSRIVVVDDDEDDREFFKIALEKAELKYELTECFNGEHLIKHLEKGDAVDFIFLDINMPKINGIECLKKIYLDERFKTIPVIMLSTASSVPAVEECYKQGAAAYIIKPNSTAALRNMVSYCINNLSNKRQSFPHFILNECVNSEKIKH